VTKGDAAEICVIYNHYVETGFISFETESVSESEMASRIQNISSTYPYLVYEEQGKVLAYAYANLWKARAAYKHSLETTIYASPDIMLKGVGRALYQGIFDALDRNTVHTLMAVIALPNEASVGFHEKMGYEKAGHFKEVGKKFGDWIDVGYWQKMM
jgi:phosphinothricin acetyltransferase